MGLCVPVGVPLAVGKGVDVAEGLGLEVGVGLAVGPGTQIGRTPSRWSGSAAAPQGEVGVRVLGCGNGLWGICTPFLMANL